MEDEDENINIDNPRQAMGLVKGLLSGKDSRIKNGSAFALMALAAIADIATFIPLVGDLVGPVFWVCVSLYLWHIGCGFVRTNRLVTEIISAIAEMLPAVQELPTIIVGMAIVILMVRFEDKTGKSIMKPAASGNLNNIGRRAPGKPAPQRTTNQQQPKNVGGVRAPSGRLY